MPDTTTATTTATGHTYPGAHLPLCATCGTQYAEPRPDCPVCQDERQYVPHDGQQWTTLAELHTADHTPKFAEQGPDVLGIGTTETIAIGQRALLLRTTEGNILWDCLPYLDDPMIEAVNDLGGITAIAISHPHFYSAMVEWAHAFDAPVHLHEADRAWVGRPDPALHFWTGETHRLTDEITLVNPEIHFPGSAVLHWSAGEGALFTGDVLNVCPDRRWITIMHSFANHIPERPTAVRHAAELLGRYRFERIYGAWWDRVVTTDGNNVLQRSVDRYLAWEEHHTH
ncbi:MBL fold metallo-hydrolase [Yinghuangia seranimata]|uniref:MBL fold metallo-hydrolase n=1 Tax=Yinghuangia seranimata TaxID=408067 RepID=UPI00248B0F59|nr:MBL fold metallo-hydrolase [Yinghuangia seranimata]MDI2127689.1 MBL fold metallo-hydrolase [Yinghuangia seranimata]